ncbi:MAG: hypothetical protein JWM86_553 [Thermoleophilia bacterium]|nr:hypothetical protein [Thermoleophilia bacterium]
MAITNDPLVGTTYDGRYRIERRIGAGGMANVYLAEDETLGRRVAIKVLHQRYAEDSQFIERFQREASAAARLNHPNIVQVYDRGAADHTYYIAMEYIDGMTLKELVQRRGALTEQEVLAYGRQALHALRFAHRNGIVHRDVKPHNLMVDTDGRLKIADFGIARAGADSGLTEAGSIVGTAQYLSPEQAQGHDVSATSDLYSLGVVMFEVATGRVPFDGEMPVNVALKHVKDPVPRPSSINKDVTPQLESIILKAMEKDPARRYASADEMLADLDRAREGGTTSAMTAVIAGIPAGAGATQVTPITPVPVSNRVYEQPVPPEPAWPDAGWDDDEPDDRRSAARWILPALIVLVLLGAALYFLLLAPKGETVPDVVGATRAAATLELKEAGFTVGDVSAAFSDEPVNTVIDQDPPGGDEADKGASIDLVLSKGPAPKAVPDVRGKARDEALAAIRSAGFVPKVSPERVASDDVKKGYVVSQEPANGTKLKAGSPVTVTLSGGPEAQTVPPVDGKSADEARAILEGDPYNYDVDEKSVESPDPEGTVVGTEPRAGSELAAGERITLLVANGFNQIPDVEGLGREDAMTALANAGFSSPEIITEATEDPAKFNVVIRVEPGEGSRAAVGEEGTVRLIVGEAAGDAEVPIEDPTAEGNNGNGNGNKKPKGKRR